jgi:predicted RNase H-like nuclease (RuvC/YqgF family)
MPHLDPDHPSAAGDLEGQIAALAGQVRRLGERLGGGALTGGRASRDPLLGAKDRLAAEMLATAESVAAEIRSSAEREAERIRAGALHEANARIASLQAMLASQRNTLAALTAEIGHLEHSATAMRATARMLDAELSAIAQALSVGAPREI